MRLSVLGPVSSGYRKFAWRVVAGLLVLFSGVLLGFAQESTYVSEHVSAARVRMHDSEQWKSIEAHLPDPATASPKVLEMQADILRARRFPEDALDYYKFAMDRGGDKAELMNKLGLTELELRNVLIAGSFFQQSLKLNKRDAEAWNNLGAVEYLGGNGRKAISDYKRAVKLDKGEAVFHANIATAYFESKKYDAARREIATAMKLDPQIFERTGGAGGIAAHLLSSADAARLAYEMAKLYAQNGMEQEMLHSLAKACEAGMDIQREMHRDPVLAKFELDPRVVVIVRNAQALHDTAPTTASVRAGTSSALGPPVGR